MQKLMILVQKLIEKINSGDKTVFELVLAIVFCASAVTLFYTWIGKFESKNNVTFVVAANKDMPAGTKLTLEDLTKVKVINEFKPETSIAGAEDVNIVGNILINRISKNEVITRNDIYGGDRSDTVGLLIEEDRKGMVLSTSWLSGNYPTLKKGDTVSFMAVTKGANGLPEEPTIISSGTHVLDIVAGNEREPSSLFLKLDLQLAAQLLKIHATPNALIQVLVDGYKPLDASTDKDKK